LCGKVVHFTNLRESGVVEAARIRSYFPTTTSFGTNAPFHFSFHSSASGTRVA
jgi:hypothetical protein